MTLFLGIDGGGSKTEALIAAEDGRIYGWQKTGPSNPLFMPPAKALENVVAAVKGAMTAQTAIMKQSITQACICIPGFEKQFSKESLVRSLGVGIEQISMMGDERSTLLAALGGKAGIVIAAGTGSFAIGRDGQNNIKSAGGWGPILGDEGSGYDMGRQALRAIVTQHENNAPTTALTEAVCSLWGIDRVQDIRLYLNSHTNFQQTISALAPLVLECAQKGDSTAKTIIRRAGYSLADLSYTVIKQLTMPDGPVKIAVSGGIRNFGDLITDPIRQRFKEEYQIEVNLCEPEFPTVIGALLLAMEKVALFPGEKALITLKENYERITGVEHGISR